MSTSTQRLLRWFLTVLVAASAAMIGTATSAGAAESEPIIVSGNPSCSSLGYDNEIKFDRVGRSGESGGVSYTATVVDDVFTVEWTSDSPVDAVITKQANGAAVFVHEPPATSGTAYVATGKDQANISHLTFCLADPVICPASGDLMTEDRDGDGDIDADDCTFVEPFTCQGDTEAMTDRDGDGDVDADDCTFVAVQPETNTPVAPVTPTEPVIEVAPAAEEVPAPAPAPPPVVEVAEVADNTVVTLAAVPETVTADLTAVLDAQTARAALPRTGNDGTTTLALGGLALVLLGTGLRRLGTRAMA